jgi:hypothetical protein
LFTTQPGRSISRILVDFGIAEASGDTHLTMAGYQVGSWDYMAPVGRSRWLSGGSAEWPGNRRPAGRVIAAGGFLVGACRL